MINYLIFLFSGLAAGLLIAWIFLRQRTNSVIQTGSLQLIRIENEVMAQKNSLDTKEKEILRLTGLVAEKDAGLRNLKERLDEQKAELVNMQDKMKTEFKNLANEILDEKSRKFTEQNREKLDEILKPFSENLKDFKRKVEETHIEGEKGRASLFTKIKDLEELNIRISNEANALTKALKGESKTQGNWGEMILETILEKSGLVKDREFFKQNSFLSDGGKRLQPDFIIKYPGDRSIVIDAKVSLTAYEKYCDAGDDKEKESWLKAHLVSVKTHINELAAKNYQDIYKINTLDFVMMFMPVEPAYFIAIQADTNLWNYAYERRILMISPTNLIAALKMVESMWRQEYQNRNVLEIAAQGGALYDDFVMFSERLLKLGRKLDDAREHYDETMKKLSTGKGNLVSRVNKLKILGVRTKKNLPAEMINDETGNDNEIPSIEP
jgi:DNA recombination protein RmuC